MPEQQPFRRPPGFYNDYHDELNRRRQQQNTSTIQHTPTIQPTHARQTPSTNENSRLFALPTPAIARRQPGGRKIRKSSRKYSRKSSKRRKTLRRFYRM